MACYSPFMVTTDEERIPVPCGKCPSCQVRRINDWVFRLKREDLVSFGAYFVTLTYAPKYLPKTPNKLATLCKRDFQLYMKRLRKVNERLGNMRKIKYYAVGEYGSIGFRPHYHAIIFNSLEDPLVDAWRVTDKVSGTSEPIGSVKLGSVSAASIGYTAKYIAKESKVPMFRNDDRVKEFSLMSRNLGASYLTPAVIRYHKADYRRNYVVYPGGAKQPLPRYYRDKIYSDYEKHLQRLHINDEMRKAKVADEDRFYSLYPGGDYDKAIEERKMSVYKKHFKDVKLNRRL